MPGFSQPGDPDAPQVRLGAIAAGGLAPAIMAIVERGVMRRPDKARTLGIEVELRMEEHYPPVRILHDLVALVVTALLGGLPSPIDARGRAALAMFASRRVRIKGEVAKMRGFLGVLTL
jgi:hypothetical protein